MMPARYFCLLFSAALWLGRPPVHATEPVYPRTVDISGETGRQVMVAAGDSDTYQGHPTTLLLPDGKTIYGVWTYGHGGACGPMKRSDDGGLTWSDLLPVPDNWTDVRNCPSLYRLTDPQGRTRIFVFAGQGEPNDTMQQAYSLDEGRTWTPMRSNGLTAVMPFCTITPVEGGRKLIGLSNARRVGETVEKNSNVLVQSSSTDGGLTWAPWKVIRDLPGLKPCEPMVVRSPDGRQLLCLIRENEKRVALFMTSDDEGLTWSETKPLPPGLWGDRHMAAYAPDGRLVVAMRDTGAGSPTRDHFIVWVGRYEDIVTGRDGAYRVKLLHSHKGWDCGYPGLEVLPGGTFVATTYIKYRAGPEKNSVVSTRFDLAETDRLAAGPPQPNHVGRIAAGLQPARTVIYKRTGNLELRLDLFEPAGFKPGDLRPGLIAFHGGGWGGGAPRMMYPFAAWAAERGMVGISVQYRRYKPDTENTVFECVKDARSALRYVRSHAAELGLDQRRLVAVGASAGAHLAAATVLFDEINEPGEDTGIPCRPDALILLSPVIDTSAAGYGQAKIGDRWRELSPRHRVRPDLPPTLLFHGTGDTLTPFAGAQAFHEAMQQAGNQCEFVVVPGGSHTYMMKDAAAYADTLRQIERFLLSLGYLPGG